MPERTCNDTRRRRDCTDCSVLPLRRCFESDSQVFLVTLSQTQWRLRLLAAQPTRVICHLALVGQDGNKYTPFPRRFQAGNAVIGNCASGNSSGVRSCAPPRWRLSMRRSRCERVTIGRSKLCPSRWPRQARPLPLRQSRHDATSCRLKPHFTISQWPVCLLPSRRINPFCTSVPIAVLMVSLLSPSLDTIAR